MTDPVRLARRVAELAGCSRTEAEQLIRNGWVSVDGQVIEQPQHRVANEAVRIDPAARAEAVEPATLIWHKPAGVDPHTALPAADARWSDDPSSIRPLQRHLHRLETLMPLEAQASGLQVLSQDRRIQRRLSEDAARIEQEYIVEVRGEPQTDVLQRLQHGLAYAGRALSPCRVSWQNETRLRFALKDPRPGQLAAMCAAVGLEPVAIRRLRIGRIGLGKGPEGGMPAGAWRYLPAGERF